MKQATTVGMPQPSVAEPKRLQHCFPAALELVQCFYSFHSYEGALEAHSVCSAWLSPRNAVSLPAGPMERADPALLPFIFSG